MPAGKPVVYILRGDDEIAIKDYLDKLYKHLGEAAIADMNFTRLEGRSLNLSDLGNATGAMPFLAERRVVVVSNPSFEAVEPERFKVLLDHLPETTALVLVLTDELDKRKTWSKYTDNHWLIQWANQAGARALVKDVLLPDPNKMAGWVLKKAVEEKGEFTPQAAAALAEHIGNDTRTATFEIQKLLAYANYSRPITREDVELVSARIDDPDIFRLVDALGEKNGKKALDELHVLMEGQDWLSVFPMIVRQFRLLLLSREIIDLGGSPERIMQDLRPKCFNVNLWMAGKLHQQARRFSMPDLEGIYRRLLALEETLKSTPIEGSVAMDILVAELTG